MKKFFICMFLIGMIIVAKDPIIPGQWVIRKGPVGGMIGIVKKDILDSNAYRIQWYKKTGKKEKRNHDIRNLLRRRRNLTLDK